MSSRTINTILNLRDNFSRGISSATSSTKQFQRQIKQAENQANKMKSGISGAFTSTAAKVTGLLGGIGLAAFAKDSLMLASDLNEVQNVVDTTFGGMSSKINDFAKTTTSQFGISELQAKKYSGVLGAMMKSSGITGDELTNMSTGLTGLSGDMASFYNLEPDEAFEKLKSAIGGETEPMKALGVNMSVANMEAFALTQGISKQWKEMSQAEQTTLRYQYIMKNTADSQGDYAKTSKGFANSLRTLKLNFQTLGAKIMSNFIPSFEKLFNKMNDFITNIDIKSWTDKATKAFDTLKNSMGFIIPIIAGVVGGLVGFMVISKVLTIFSTFKKIIMGTTTVLKAFNLTLLANPVTWIAIAIGVAVAAMVLAYKRSETFRNYVNQLFDKFKEFGSWLAAVLPPILAKIGQFFNEKVLPVLDQLGNWIMEHVMPALKQFGNFFMTSILPVLQKFGDFIMTYIVPALAKFGDFFVTTIIPNFEKFAQKVLDLWTNKLLPFFAWLIAAIQPLIDVFLPQVGAVVSDLFKSIGNIIDGAISIFGGLIDFITGVFTGDWSLAWDGIKGIFSGVFEGLEGLVRQPLNTVIRLVNMTIQGINDNLKFDVPDWVPKIGGSHVGANIPKIPEFATGTQYFGGGIAKINEGKRGEIVNLPNGSQVIPHDVSMNMAKNSNGINVHVTIQGNVIGNEEYADYVGNHIVKKINLELGNM